MAIQLGDGGTLALAQVRTYQRRERGRTETVRAHDDRRPENGWIPNAKWKAGQREWVLKGEEARERDASELKPDEGSVSEQTPSQLKDIRAGWYGPGAQFTNYSLRDGPLPVSKEGAYVVSLAAKAKPFTAPVKLYRGVEQAGKVFGRIGSRVGLTFTDKGLVSTSDSMDVWNMFGASELQQPGGEYDTANIVVHAPAGSRALKGLPEFFAPGNELPVTEYTFPAGSRYRVRADQMEGSRRVIDLDVVNTP